MPKIGSPDSFAVPIRRRTEPDGPSFRAALNARQTWVDDNVETALSTVMSTESVSRSLTASTSGAAYPLTCSG